MKRTLASVGAAIALLLVGSAGALAGPGYNYAWQTSQGTFPSDTAGQGTIILQGIGPVYGVVSTNVVAARVWVTSVEHYGAPTQFSNDAYTLSLTITDEPSGKSGVLSFHGELDGTAWKHGSKITNTLTGPLTQTIALGNEQYKVTIGPYVPPGPPGVGNAGAIGATINVHDLSNSPSGTPEPSTLALAGLGLVITGVAGWRKRRLAARAV